jgi:hypothetical protein
MVAILNQKWPPKCKNPPIWAKFGFQVDYDVANWYPSFGSHIISYLVVFAPFLIMSPKQSFRRHIVFALFIIKSPNKVWRLIFFAPFLIIIKSPNEVWRLIVFAPFLLIIIIIMNVCQNLWPHLYRKLPKGFLQDLAYILNRVGRIFWPKKIASKWPPFSNWPPTKLAKFQCSLILMKIYIHIFVLKGVQIGVRFTTETCA